MAIPYAGEGRPQDPSSFVNLRTEAGWKLRNRLDATYMKAVGRRKKACQAILLRCPFLLLPFALCRRHRSTFALARTITPAAKKVIYPPEARARDPVRFPRSRVGLVCGSMRNFLAGVICPAGR